MPGTITVGSGTGLSVLNYTSNDTLAFSLGLAATITANEASGAYTNFNFVGAGSLASGPASGTGDATFMQPTQFGVSGNPIAVLVPTGDFAVIDAAAGPLSIQGGAAGGIFLAGSGLAGATRNVTYTNITPTGNATDLIAILGGNNLVQTSVSGGGNYNVQTGSGNDTINALTGNSTINAGTGTNQINFGSGNNFVFSEGYDTITGSSVGGGSDTVYIGSGQTSINTGTSNFQVDDASPNPFLISLGSGTDTVNLGPGASGTFASADTKTSTVTGVGTVVAVEASKGDGYTITGGANATINAGPGNDTINGLGDSGNNKFFAGTGNDTLIAGAGPVTLGGAQGASATAIMISSPVPSISTEFAFNNGGSGGADTIQGFKADDVIAFKGYGSNPQGTAVMSGSSTIITLGDGTTITVVGAQVSAGQYKVS